MRYEWAEPHSMHALRFSGTYFERVENIFSDCEQFFGLTKTQSHLLSAATLVSYGRSTLCTCERLGLYLCEFL